MPDQFDLLMSEIRELRHDSRATLEKVTRLEERVSEVPEVEAKIDKVEERVGHLERLRWAVTGALAAGGSALSGQIYHLFARSG